jgi:3,4-dihydroxy 2-butanone 4-phosphate synthase/GTP cyclohydrolase II
MPTEYGDFRLISYLDGIDNKMHIALVCGEITPDDATLVRVHVIDTLRDVLGANFGDSGMPLRVALQSISAAGRGVIVVLCKREDQQEIIHRIKNYQLLDKGVNLPRQQVSEELRSYGLGAQMLVDLGVRRMRVLGAPKKLHGLAGFGLEVVEYVNITAVSDNTNA